MIEINVIAGNYKWQQYLLTVRVPYAIAACSFEIMCISFHHRCLRTNGEVTLAATRTTRSHAGGCAAVATSKPWVTRRAASRTPVPRARRRRVPAPTPSSSLSCRGSSRIPRGMSSLPLTHHLHVTQFFFFFIFAYSAHHAFGCSLRLIPPALCWCGGGMTATSCMLV